MGQTLIAAVKSLDCEFCVRNFAFPSWFEIAGESNLDPLPEQLCLVSRLIHHAAAGWTKFGFEHAVEGFCFWFINSGRLIS